MKIIKLPNISFSSNKKIKLMKIEKLKTNSKFQALYSQEPEKVEALSLNIKEHGFDPTQPIIILNDGTIIDGHSRLLAAIKAGLKEVYVIVKEDINNETDALIYEEHLQLSRRNLTESQKLIHLENLLNLKKQAMAEGKDVSSFTDEAIGKKLDISTRQVQKMREVEAKATPQQLELIRSGEASLNHIHEQIKKAEGPSRKSLSTKTVSAKTDLVSEVICIIQKYFPDCEIKGELKNDLKKLFKCKE